MDQDLGVDATIYSPRHPKTSQNNGKGTGDRTNDDKTDEDLKGTLTTFLLTAHKGVRRSIDKVGDGLRDKVKELKKRRDEKRKNKEKNQLLQTDSLDDVRELKKLPVPPDVDTYSEEDKPLIYPIISATILSFPYAFKEAGFPLGLIMMLVVAVMVDYSEVLLVQCSVLADDISLQSIAKDTFGTPGSFFLYGIPYLLSLSVLVAYNIIIADTFTSFINALFQLLNFTTIGDRRVVLLLLTSVIIPLSMTTNAKRMFRWSLLSIVSTTFIVVFVSVRWLTLTAKSPQALERCKFLNINVLQSFGIITFAICCQHTCRLYYSTIERTRDTSANTRANLASSYSLLCTCVLGVLGYLTFKSSTQCNILDNYCDGDVLAMIGRLLVTASAVCLFPLECQNMRHLLKQVIVVHKQLERGMNFVVTLLVLAPPLCVAMVMDCLPMVLSVPGLVLAVPLVFLVPPIFFLKLSPGKISSTKKLPCLVCIVVGSTASICGLTMEVFHRNSSCSGELKTMSYCNETDDLLGPQITLSSLNDSSVSRFSNDSLWA